MALWLGLTAGNFVYQALTDRHWLNAAERSYFQGVALLLAALIWKEA